MTGRRQNEKLFDALLEAAVSQAFQEEMEQLPSNEELNAECKPSPELDLRIKELIDQNRRKAKRKHFRRRSRKIAAGIAVVFTLLATVTLSVEATRNRIFNAYLDWQDKYTSIQFKDTTDPTETKVIDESDLYHPTYIPKGFKQTSTEKYGRTIMLVYSNEDGIEILFNQRPAGTGATSVDNEHKTYREVEISGNKAYLFEGITEEYASVLIWQAGGVEFQLTSLIDSAELIYMGESIKK